MIPRPRRRKPGAAGYVLGGILVWTAV